jgi:hypothetical protein
MTATAPPNDITPGQRLGRTRAQVNEWVTYVGTPQLAQPGSSLAKDDALFDLLPPSHVAWQGISAAVDHLDAFLGLLDGGKSHPVAPGTLARSGVLGAAHSLWVLDPPERAERQRRSLRLAHEEFRRERQLLIDVRDLGGDPDGNVQRIIDIRTEWMTRAVTVGATVGMLPAAVRQLDDTTLIDEVAARYVAVVPGSAELAKLYRVVWRIYSGTAHGLRWSSLLRTAATPSTDGVPGSGGYVTNDLGDLDLAASAVSVFTSRAIDLYEKRRQRH